MSIISKVKNWLKRRDLEHQVLSKKLDIIREQLAFKVLRPVNTELEDFISREEDEMGEDERSRYAASVSAIYPILERDIKRFMSKWAERVLTSPQDWEQSLVFRGEFSGMDFLLNYWKNVHLEHREKLKPKDEVDMSNPFPEIKGR